MKNLFIILVLFAISPSLVAQEEETTKTTEAVVILKDGTRVKGEIIKWQLDEYITLQMPWGKYMTIKDDKIKSVIQEGTEVRVVTPYKFMEKGVYFSAKAQVISGNEGNRAHGVYGFGISASAGYRFNRLLGIGGGVGFDKYIWDSGEQLIPIFAEINGFFIPTNTSLFYNFQAGYSFAQKSDEHLLTEANGGVMLYPSLGLRFGKEKTKVLLDVGYKFQYANYTYRDVWTVTSTSEQDLLYKRICFRIGVTL